MIDALSDQNVNRKRDRIERQRHADEKVDRSVIMIMSMKFKRQLVLPHYTLRSDKQGDCHNFVACLVHQSIESLQ